MEILRSQENNRSVLILDNTPTVLIPEDSLDYQTLVALMNIYLQEWIHRGQGFWREITKYFYATLLIACLPNIAQQFSFDIDWARFPSATFPALGILMSLLFLFVTSSNAARIRAVGGIYRDLIDMLPEAYRRPKIREMDYGKIEKYINVKKLFDYPIYSLLPIIMFSATFIISVVFFHYHITSIPPATQP